MHRPSATRHAPPRLLAAILALAGLTACTGNVAVDGQWTEGVARQGSFGNFLVVGISTDYNQRCAFEYALVSSLRDEAISASTSCSVISKDEPLSRESVVKAAQKTGADAVLATHIVEFDGKAKEGASADARGGLTYKATDIEQYFATTVVTAKMVTAPSVFTISGTVRLSTRLFETKGATLVYAMDTRAKELESRGSGLAEIAPAIVRRLRSDGLLR